MVFIFQTNFFFSFLLIIIGIRLPNQSTQTINSIPFFEYKVSDNNCQISSYCDNMDVDGISAIRYHSQNQQGLNLQKRESLISARSLLHDGTLKMRPTQSRVISSQGVSLTPCNEPLTTSNRNLRCATQVDSDRRPVTGSSLENSSHTTKKLTREKKMIRNINNSERTYSVNKRKKIFPQQSPFIFKIPPLTEYYSVKRQSTTQSGNALNLSFADDMKGVSTSNFMDSHGPTRIGETLLKSIPPKTQPTVQKELVQTNSSKDTTKSLIMWISFMVAVILIIGLKVSMFV